MKTYIGYSLTRNSSFLQESVSWQELRAMALSYYGVQYLYYKEVRTDDFFIDSMLGLVGSIKLSLHPNSEPIFIIKVKETDVKRAYQMNMHFEVAQKRVAV